MNISHKHKTIWWAPERTGSKITRKILQNYDFLVFDPKTNDEVTIEKRYTSHLIDIPETFSDYRLICNIRNPYDRVFSIFFLTWYENIVIEKNSYDKVKKAFNIWVSDVFEPKKTIVKIDKNYFSENLNLGFFSKWTFDNRKPDFFIKMENLKEDLEKLDFIGSDKKWDSSKIDELLSNNIYRNDRNIKFDQMYDFYTAKLVYLYFKSVFNLVPYNPFSFTTENLSESEKISFLHDIL